MENRRRYPRYESELEARIYTADLDLSVIVIDISESGICVISEQPIGLEAEVNISLFPLSEDPVKGTPVWSSYIEEDQKNYYRIGVKTDPLSWTGWNPVSQVRGGVLRVLKDVKNIDTIFQFLNPSTMAMDSDKEKSI